MGRLMSKLLYHDHEIISVDRDDWPVDPGLLDEADCVMVCVTMANTINVIDEIAPLLREDQGLCDITSIKAPIVDHMLSVHHGPVLGMHPIFGPHITECDYPFVFCEAREHDFFMPLIETFEVEGFDCIEMGADEHDRLMDVVQGLNYSVLRHYVQQVDEAEWRESVLAEVINSFLGEDQSLYDSIINATAQRKDFIDSFWCEQAVDVEEYQTRLRNKIPSAGLSATMPSDNTLARLCLREFDTALRLFSWAELERVASPNYREKMRYCQSLLA